MKNVIIIKPIENIIIDFIIISLRFNKNKNYILNEDDSEAIRKFTLYDEDNLFPRELLFAFPNINHICDVLGTTKLRWKMKYHAMGEIGICNKAFDQFIMWNPLEKEVIHSDDRIYEWYPNRRVHGSEDNCIIFIDCFVADNKIRFGTKLKNINGFGYEMNYDFSNSKSNYLVIFFQSKGDQIKLLSLDGIDL